MTGGRLGGGGGSASASPGDNMPPMAAGPADGSRAVLPAASPAAEMPGLGLDMMTMPRAQGRRGTSLDDLLRRGTFPGAQDLHVTKPPVKVERNALRYPPRREGRPRLRDRRPSPMASRHGDLAGRFERGRAPRARERTPSGQISGAVARSSHGVTAPYGNWPDDQKLASTWGDMTTKAKSERRRRSPVAPRRAPVDAGAGGRGGQKPQLRGPLFAIVARSPLVAMRVYHAPERCFAPQARNRVTGTCAVTRYDRPPHVPRKEQRST
jgi:hypothetical protein